MTIFQTVLLTGMVLLPAALYASELKTDEAITVTSDARQFDTPLASSDTEVTAPAHNQRSHDETLQSLSTDYWIYDSWVSLSHDPDGDGYYSSFSVTLDADTIYRASAVYAVIYVGRHDVYDAIYTTSDFMLYGDDSEDALTIENDLLSGFPSREYHLLVELYDANTHALLAFSDDYQDADLAFLSLESQNYESTYRDAVVVVDKHGGSLASASLLWLTALALQAALRRRTRELAGRR
ncbi:choice-of-anchor H family protein [Alteromonas halophila]|uniref:GlyGly-CTERM sorting domain-containing protein n=1 Tax=Alteromonas halophila TaxID=516698 RepID=A0A918JP30_9ALTE|nr:choice-of-anchor H family protein [Alteromonas halophila]GGW93061.1 hypothetical protein GCM10007391_29170 [Alteromonas halophila]